ncbi:30S ribosomal protein S4 [Methanosarcina sp. 2.H.T.1A.6]|uniref:30S ribosomal protein S4 n=1 Tax=unclassified Methanosarcina TaxID=2644672 RepID=UPI0006228914|nr:MULTISPECIES: 30S ribosomal protein S4 [unclassified Methanosarcina]KKG16798.1 30S ribosomal protein S4 [Methanosarcina sp. 2.H.T.1A.15]KKG18292.1 30S ribosomal protein S4 [Methanosarcina sp. 2.H.T.1A.3]KKG20988.1 30S ribosomal protein S4 [Methanosarcina sp. 2.H.T.1A.6]KKG23271.1 30S ribosomal protein S4 [Methanosarcina sp. 2.H.T.1A.8]KKH91870.1 30S ribosomal protein S4 [Methanosarcina sp. 1.H.T.1A.1]
MAYPGKKSKSYETPRHPWQEARMAAEVQLVKAYGLRNKKEVWKAASMLRMYRSEARNLLANVAGGQEGGLEGHLKTQSEEILAKLIRYGIIKSDANIDDILSLKTENILERRLQTQVLRLGLARTVVQARQFITHGHIAINGRKATIPGMLVSKEDEMHIGYYGNSPLMSEAHPERPVQVASYLADSATTLKAAAEAKQARERPAERRGGPGGKKKRGGRR